MSKSKFTFSPNLIWPLVILVIAFGAFWLKPWQTKPVESVSVQSQGTAKTAPDIAKITATVTTQNTNIDQARAQTDAKISQIISALTSLGIPQKDIQTQNISGSKSYEIQTYPPRPKPTTNEFSTSLEVTIRNFQLADKVISTLTQSGATNLYGPNLTFDENTLEKAKSLARQKAVENAKQKAQELAKASGRSIGKVTNIKEQGDYSIPGPLMAVGGTDLEQKASNIQPGQDQVSINLVVDFSLK